MFTVSKNSMTSGHPGFYFLTIWSWQYAKYIDASQLVASGYYFMWTLQASGGLDHFLELRRGSAISNPPAPWIPNANRQRVALRVCWGVGGWYGLDQTEVVCPESYQQWSPSWRGNLMSGECNAGQDSSEPVCETVSRAKFLILLVLKSKSTVVCHLLCVACDRVLSIYLSVTFFDSCKMIYKATELRKA